MGNLAFTRNNFVFPQILNTETKSDSIEVYNKGEKAIKIDFKKPASHIDVSIEPMVILPGKTAVIHLTYDASQTGTFGFKSNDRLHLQTDDSLQVTKVIYISANIKEDFSGLTKEELENAPAVHFEEKIFDFGERPNNENVTHSYIF